MALAINCNNPPDGEVGIAYLHPVSFGGGVPPYTVLGPVGWVPLGLALLTDGRITGTPTQAGTSTFTVRVVDATYATADAVCSITIREELTIDCADPPDGEVDTPYAHDMDVSGGNPPRTVALVAGSLPDGLSIDTAGVITGTPTQAGTFTFTARVTGS
jgi:hypothetical protein